ncbi:unnamed protein product [Camellia sinensis]
MEYDMHFLASKEPLKLCHRLVQSPEVNGDVGVFGTSQLDVC